LIAANNCLPGGFISLPGVCNQFSVVHMNFSAGLLYTVYTPVGLTWFRMLRQGRSSSGLVNRYATLLEGDVSDGIKLG